MEYKDTIDQGATYYKEVVLYADARKTELFSTDGSTVDRAHSAAPMARPWTSSRYFQVIRRFIRGMVFTSPVQCYGR